MSTQAQETRQLQEAQEAHRTAVETTISEIAETLVEALGRSLVAYLAGGVETKTVSRWVAGTSHPRSDAEVRLRAAFQTFQLLLSRDSDHTARAWFIGLNPQLDDVSPAQALHDGDTRDVLLAAKSFTLGG